MSSQTELRELALARLVDAQVLFDFKRYDAAAYMCGYALELGLKACICKRLRVPEYPEAALEGRFKTHVFDDLRLLAGLEGRINLKENPGLHANWNTVASWRPEWRYRPAGSTKKKDVEDMLKALREQENGVLSWLRKRW